MKKSVRTDAIQEKLTAAGAWPARVGQWKVCLGARRADGLAQRQERSRASNPDHQAKARKRNRLRFQVLAACTMPFAVFALMSCHSLDAKHSCELQADKLYAARAKADESEVARLFVQPGTEWNVVSPDVDKLMQKDRARGSPGSRRCTFSSTGLNTPGHGGKETFTVALEYDVSLPQGHAIEEIICKTDEGGMAPWIVSVKMGEVSQTKQSDPAKQ
jgi:hypothetical protein